MTAPVRVPDPRRLLLDTHVVLWWQDESPRLAPAASHAIAAADRVFVSLVTAWEVAIKVGSGKLAVGASCPEALEENRFGLVPVTLDHVGRVGALPLHHRDPFDRRLVAQAAHEGLTLVTHDRQLAPYPVPILGT